MLAGLLYLGAGVGLFALSPLQRGEAPLQRSDVRWLAGLVVSGGVVGPVLLMLGLSRLPGVTASLLLNLEAPFTIALAVLALREPMSWREAAGGGAIVVGGAALGASSWAIAGDAVGVLAVAGACAAWAVDNNLSQRLSIRDPVAVARVKTVTAGIINVTLGFVAREGIVSARALVGATCVGAVGYGASIVLHLLATRRVGAARQAAYFASAPFFGAVAAIPLLGERVSSGQWAGGAAMVVGLVVLLRSRHGHAHRHEAIEHEHAHIHDEHHGHAHGDLTEDGSPHSHAHRHVARVHDHPHLPDIHHRHGHE